MAVFSYSEIERAVLEDVVDVDLLRWIENVRYLAEDVSGDPASSNDEFNGTIFTAESSSKLLETYTRDVAVEPPRRGVAISPSSGSFTADTAFQIPNLGVSLQTTGRPVYVGLTGVDGLLSQLEFGEGSSSPANVRIRAVLRIRRDGSDIHEMEVIHQFSNSAGATVNTWVPVSMVNTLDWNVPEGLHTYDLTCGVTGGNDEYYNFENARLFAYEL